MTYPNPPYPSYPPPGGVASANQRTERVMAPGVPAGPPTPPPATADSAAYQVGTLGVRLAARGLDALIQGVTLGVLGAVFFGISFATESPWPAVLFVFCAIPAIVLYEVLFVAKSGATPGKKAMGLRVIREEDGKPPSVGAALGRYAVLFLACPVFYAGGVLVFISPLLVSKPDRTLRRGWPDRGADTRVIKLA